MCCFRCCSAGTSYAATPVRKSAWCGTANGASWASMECDIRHLAWGHTQRALLWLPSTVSQRKCSMLQRHRTQYIHQRRSQPADKRAVTGAAFDVRSLRQVQPSNHLQTRNSTLQDMPPSGHQATACTLLLVLGLYRGGTRSRRPSVSSAAPASSPNTRRSLPLHSACRLSGPSATGCIMSRRPSRRST
jgi:hypothetical protein